MFLKSYLANMYLCQFPNTWCCKFELGESSGGNQSFQLSIPGIDMPDQSCFSLAGGLHPQQHGTQVSGNADQGTAPVGGVGRRPSLAQIIQIQKQQTIDNEDYNDKVLLASAPSPEPAKTRTGQQGAEYDDTKNLFRGLQQDYAWMEGINNI